MRIPGLKTVHLAGRWLGSRFTRRALILGYHRVGQSGRDTYRMCVSAGHFREQLAVLRRHASLVSLAELTDGLTSGRLPDRAVAVTFDDGYEDVYAQAGPLLEEFGVPATVFVVSGGLGQVFWWDRLEQIVFQAKTLPLKLTLRDREVQVEWALAAGKPDPEERIRLVLTLYQRLKDLQPGQREGLLGNLRDWIGVTEVMPGPRAMNGDEVRVLAQSGLVEFGSHSVSHPFLPGLSPNQVRSELSASKTQLEGMLGQPVHGFSFPNGRIPPGASELLASLGYRWACTSQNGPVSGQSDPFLLTRFWIPDWDGARFEGWLKRWI